MVSIGTMYSLMYLRLTTLVTLKVSFMLSSANAWRAGEANALSSDNKSVLVGFAAFSMILVKAL